MEISFTSTYRIPITQAGVNNAKKIKLRELIESYPNGLIGKSKQGYARVSMPDSEDENFIRKLKGIGYKIYQRFDGENIDADGLDIFIKQKLDARDFNQKGKNPAPLPKEMKEQRKFERKFGKVQEEVEEIKQPKTDTIEEVQTQVSSKPKIKRSKMEY
jgi:hypothetical protein